MVHMDGTSHGCSEPRAHSCRGPWWQVLFRTVSRMLVWWMYVLWCFVSTFSYLNHVSELIRSLVTLMICLFVWLIINSHWWTWWRCCCCCCCRSCWSCCCWNLLTITIPSPPSAASILFNSDSWVQNRLNDSLGNSQAENRPLGQKKYSWTMLDIFERQKSMGFL